MLQAIEDILPTLKSLKGATTARCSETLVYISMVCPVTHSPLNRPLKPVEAESGQVADFKKTVAASLKKQVAPQSTTDAGKLWAIKQYTFV